MSNQTKVSLIATHHKSLCLIKQKKELVSVELPHIVNLYVSNQIRLVNTQLYESNLTKTRNNRAITVGNSQHMRIKLQNAFGNTVS